VAADQKHLAAGKSVGALGDQFERLLGLQVHEQAFGGDEHPVGRFDGVYQVRPEEPAALAVGVIRPCDQTDGGGFVGVVS
jgi:hypothetical protein